MSETTVVKKRPTGVTIIAVLAVLVGILDLIAGALMLMSSTFVAGMSEGMLGGIISTMGGILVLIGIVGFVIAYGLLKGMSWAWALGLAFWIIDVILGFLMLPIGIVRIIVGSLMSFYLTRPHIRKFFEKVTPSTPPLPE